MLRRALYVVITQVTSLSLNYVFQEQVTVVYDISKQFIEIICELVDNDVMCI